MDMPTHRVVRQNPNPRGSPPTPSSALSTWVGPCAAHRAAGRLAVLAAPPVVAAPASLPRTARSPGCTALGTHGVPGLRRNPLPVPLPSVRSGAARGERQGGNRTRWEYSDVFAGVRWAGLRDLSARAVVSGSGGLRPLSTPSLSCR